VSSSELLTISERLPDRDLALLDLLYEHRYLTRRHIQSFYFSVHRDPRDGRLVATRTPRMPQRRLQRLREAGLLERRQLARPDGRPEPEPYYCLSPNGVRLVAHRQQLPSRTTRKRDADALAHPLFVRHALAAADLHSALNEAARTNASHRCLPEWWRGEDATSHEFADRGSSYLLRPDGYTRYQAADDIHHLLVEIDLGTMTLARLAAKLERYRSYARAGAWKDRYPVFPKLLLTTTSERRIRSLHTELEPLPELVLLTTTYEQLEQLGPLAAIWQQPGRHDPRTLLAAHA
jgi:hypothetical protein